MKPTKYSINKLCVRFLFPLFLLLCFYGITASASNAFPTIPKTLKLYAQKNYTDIHIARAADGKASGEYRFPAGTKITNIKSSNAKVVTAKKSSNNYGVYLELQYKKAGTATISFKATLNGKSKSYKTKITLYKWSNPIKQLKIGKRDYTSKFAKNWYYLFGDKAPSGKLSLSLKRDWKLVKIEESPRYQIGKKVLSDDLFSIPLAIVVKNKKTGGNAVVCLSMDQYFGSNG